MIEFKKIIIHHSAEIDTENLDFDSAWDWHVLKQKFEWLGYHAFVEYYLGLAVVIPGRPLWKIGAHCRGQNRDSLGICFAGNFNYEMFQTEWIDLIWEGAVTIASWMEFFKIPASEIHPHSHFSVTDCPGKKFPLDYLISKAEEIRKARYRR